MKLSIVTISFNQARFLEAAILSVLNQSYPDIEYIVVDPGSTDGSREIIEKYSERIQHIIYEKDDGPADGLNKGFGKATGEIYAFLNADDILNTNAATVFVNEFHNSDADVISAHGYIIDQLGNFVCKKYSHKFNMHSYVYGACVLFQQSTFFRSDIYKKVGGFNKENRVNWDGELWFEMARSGAKFKRINRFLSSFRIYDQSITGSGNFLAIAENERLRLAQLIGIKNSNNPYICKWQLIKARFFDPNYVVMRIFSKL